VQFHALSAVVAMPNTLIPFVAGLYVDALGSEEGSVLASFLIFLGSALTCLGANIGAYPILLFGRAVYGIGGGCIVVSC
jgi:MFS family permease